MTESNVSPEEPLVIDPDEVAQETVSEDGETWDRKLVVEFTVNEGSVDGDNVTVGYSLYDRTDGISDDPDEQLTALNQMIAITNNNWLFTLLDIDEEAVVHGMSRTFHDLYDKLKEDKGEKEARNFLSRLAREADHVLKEH